MVHTFRRYFFHIRNGKLYKDERGEEHRDGAEAWSAAKRLTRDIDDTLQPNGRRNVEVADTRGSRIASRSLEGSSDMNSVRSFK
jgi:hypothetical protein